MNELHLSQTTLLDVSVADGKQSSSWASNYAADLWNNPEEHILEIGAAALLVAGVAVSRSGAARRLLSKFESAGGVKEVSEASAKVVAPPADPFRRLSDKDLSNAVTKLKEQNGIELSSWGKTKIEGAQNSESLVLRSSNGDALKVQRGSEVVYAHKISTMGGDTTLSYYSRSPFNLKNPWVLEENASWPLHNGGPLDGLKKAGVNILEMHKPRGFHFPPDLSSLTVKWTDLKVATDVSSKVSASAKGKFANAQEYASVQVTGPDAVLTGKGIVSFASRSKK